MKQFYQHLFSTSCFYKHSHQQFLYKFKINTQYQQSLIFYIRIKKKKGGTKNYFLFFPPLPSPYQSKIFTPNILTKGDSHVWFLFVYERNASKKCDNKEPHLQLRMCCTAQDMIPLPRSLPSELQKDKVGTKLRTVCGAHRKGDAHLQLVEPKAGSDSQPAILAGCVYEANNYFFFESNKKHCTAVAHELAASITFTHVHSTLHR